MTPNDLERGQDNGRSRLGTATSEAVIWVPVGMIPIANGIARIAFYERMLGPEIAALVSTAVDIALILIYAAFAQRRWPVGGKGLARGILWGILSTANHLLLGHFAFAIAWQDLLQKYEVTAGETWLLITLAILAAPRLAVRL